jgi:hypothetical protein
MFLNASERPLSKQMNKTISLNGEWQIRWDDGERGERIAPVLAGNVKRNRSWPAQVPSSVHESLIAAGVIPEPILGANVMAYRWVEKAIWYYRRIFEGPELAARRPGAPSSPDGRSICPAPKSTNPACATIRDELHDRLLHHLDRVQDPLRGDCWVGRPWRTTPIYFTIA